MTNNLSEAFDTPEFGYELAYGPPQECEHDWKEMRWQDAYPAWAGQTCTKCKKYKLQW